MGWSGSLTASSTVGSAITYTPDTTTAHGYTVGTFTAPKKGVYRFVLKGSGGTYNGDHDDGVSAAGGTGGTTTGYLLLEAGQTVYVGAGGSCSAAFVSKATGAALKNIAQSNLYFVAGAGGGGGAMWGNGYNNHAAAGGNGGGTTGANGSIYGGYIGYGGTQTAAGQGNGGYGDQGGYGYGGLGGYGNDGYSMWRGDGGDGLYGGGAGGFPNGGGGGSGYIHTSSVTVASTSYTNSTSQGGGAGSNGTGSVAVTYYAAAELPVTFDGVKLMQIIFNGTKVEHLVYNGTAVFMNKLKRNTAAIAERVMALLRRSTELREALA